MALAKEKMLLAAVRADKIGHILYQPQNRYFHKLGHFYGFFHDHTHQFLRAGNHHDAVYGDGLQNRQGDISGARGHVDIHYIHILPDDVRPKLLYRTGNDGTRHTTGEVSSSSSRFRLMI